MSESYYKPCRELDICNELIEKYFNTQQYEKCFEGHLTLAEQGYPLAECQIGYFYYDGDTIDLGGRTIQALHTPGHSPGHLCFWEAERGHLFSGDLVYKGTLFANYPSTDPQSFLDSLEKIAVLPAKRIFPGHHILDIGPEIVMRMRDAFRALDVEGKLQHGSGTHNYGDWAVML